MNTNNNQQLKGCYYGCGCLLMCIIFPFFAYFMWRWCYHVWTFLHETLDKYI